MKQSKELNKAIENAIKAAHDEREEMIKQRDIWERAINEKDRQIDTLESMLTPRKLAFSIEVEEEKEKPFDDVWKGFVKTLHEETLKSKGCLERGRKWCELFYNYKSIDTSIITSSPGYSHVEAYVFVPFLDYVNESRILVDNEQYEVETGTSGYMIYNGYWLINSTNERYIIRRIKPTT